MRDGTPVNLIITIIISICALTVTVSSGLLTSGIVTEIYNCKEAFGLVFAVGIAIYLIKRK